MRVDAADVGAGVDEHLGHLGVAALGRPVQRRHAVALRGADVGALLEQRADRVAIALASPHRPPASSRPRRGKPTGQTQSPHDETERDVS